MMSIKKLYLVSYNLACATGWGVVLFSCLKNFAAQAEPQALYDDVEKVLQIVQTAALMEVLHALFGVVRSPWLTTMLQVASRLILVWAFLWAVPSTQAQIGAVLCITSWAAVEIPRYLFYASGVLGSCPYALFYLRYSLFFVLYPTGIAGEVMTVLAALPELQDSKDSLSLGVGPVRVSGYLASIALLLLYVPIGPFLYMYMVGNRRIAFKKRQAISDKKIKSQ